MPHPLTPAPARRPPPTLFLPAAKAAAIDAALMSPPYSHTLPQLMELAGLAVAHAVADYVPPQPVCLVCGPGNNGGDGLVAARHLRHFAYPVSVVYPKRRARPPFAELVAQLEARDVPFVDRVPPDASVVVDAIFGFSFDGAAGVRPPFDALIADINRHPGKLVAVDVPSGWHVDRGPVYETCVRPPDMLVSLTAPKLCAADYAGVHYVGGRFVPDRLCKELDFTVPDYEGSSGIARIS